MRQDSLGRATDKKQVFGPPTLGEACRISPRAGSLAFRSVATNVQTTKEILMHRAALTRRLYALVWLPLAITVGLLLVTTNTALAHPCEDNYTLAINRANCWWRYANDQSIPEDMSDDMMKSDGM